VVRISGKDLVRIFGTRNYDELAASYDRRYQDEDYSGIEHALLEFIGSGSSLRVLGVGCVR
jgi:hypothetical protein